MRQKNSNYHNYQGEERVLAIYCTRLLQRIVETMRNLAISIFFLLVSLSLFLAAPMADNSSTVSPPERTEAEYLQDLKAGLQVLKTIAVSEH